MKNNYLYKQCPMLVSKTKITHENLSEYQLDQIKNKRKSNNILYKSSDKLIPNLGSDKNCYLNFRMYQMFLKAGYEIKIKKVLQFKQDDVFKKYVEDLYEMKKRYSLEDKKGMTFLVKIMLNALYGSFLVNKERFRNLKIITNEKQAEKYIKLNNIHSVMIFNQFTLIACWLLAQLYNCKLFVVCCLYSLSLFI